MNGTIRYTIRPFDTLWMLAQVFNTTVDSLMELNPGINPTNLQVGQVITIMPGYQYYPSFDNMGEDEFGDVLPDLIDYFRMLWEQHITWTRIVAMGIIYDLPELEFATQRLFRNPMDFANALRPFYGDEGAQAFADLFTEHITIAAEIVQAAKAGDTASVDEIWQRWVANANAIAELLGSINPNWSTEDWSAMLLEHLELLRDNVASTIAGNYQESINGFDDVEAQALEMADMMAEGISAQFPDEMGLSM